MEKENHSQNFKQFVEKNNNLIQGSIGYAPRGFWSKIQCEGGISFKGVVFNSNVLSKEKLNRESLIKIVNNNNTEFIVKIISIFAWGQMKVENAVIFFGYYNKYYKELEKILTDRKKNRIEIYDAILKLDLKNCKPAYFTKLIFFFTSETNYPGYIMDQWTAKSINMIMGQTLVTLDNNGTGYVTIRNDKQVYKAFCHKVENLAKDTCYNGSQIEQYLFDKGGRKKEIGEWRKYVKENYNEFNKEINTIVKYK